MKQSAIYKRQWRGVVLLFAAWLGILLPAATGVKIETVRLTEDGLLVASLCSTIGVDGPEGTQDPSQSVDPKCFFCFAATHSVLAGADPVLLPFAVFPKQIQAFIHTCDVPEDSLRPNTIRVRGPPIVLA